MSEPAEKEQRMEQVRRKVTGTPFDLATAPLFRFCLLKLAPAYYQVIYNMHHIISDGWSLELIKQEFMLLYEGYRQGEEVELPPLPLQYKDFARWHDRQLAEPERNESHRFWKEKLAGGVPVLQLPADWPGVMDDHTGAAYRYMIDRDIRERLKKVAEDNHVTLFSVMFSIFVLFLSDISNQQEVACSIIAAGRDHPSLHPIVGFFVNSLILNVRVDERQPFTGFLRLVNAHMIEVFQHQSYPLEPVFEELGVRYPEIPASLNMINLGDTDIREMPEHFVPHHIDRVQDVKFDLEGYLTEYSDGIDAYWVYKKNMFETHTLAYMMNQYLILLDVFSRNPGFSLRDSISKGKEQETGRFKKKKREIKNAGTKI